jgi:1,4-alpha-glucan branching enzyme
MKTDSVTAAITALVAARNHDPFALLGPHPVRAADGQGGLAVRAFHPAARAVTLVLRPSGDSVPMRRRHRDGLFEAVVPGWEGAVWEFDYRLRVEYADGHAVEFDDPYRYGPVLTDFDLHLLAEGTQHRAQDKLGAHLVNVGVTPGVHFAVWAPSAERVSVIGDFNGWDGRVNPMRVLLGHGVWEIFIPGLGPGEKYKFEIRSRAGTVVQKADPYAMWSEAPPLTASVVWNTGGYEWGDRAWMEERAGAGGWLDRPMSIYEVHLGSWARVPEEGWRSLTYREMAERLVPHVKQMGYTHIELLPVMEHPFSGSWGYQVTGFFAPTSRFGTPQEFKAFVDACHQSGLGVILDWVPGHFPKDSHGLGWFDGTALYEHADPRQGEHSDWGTLVFNYGRNEVRSFLLSSALFWLGEYHVDGLRVDAVASMLYLDYSRKMGQWIPNQYGGRENLEAIDFVRQMNVLTHAKFPGSITIAEESTAWPAVSRPVHLGGLGFTYKWNMGWMHDMLEYMRHDPVYRRWAHNKITFSMLYAFHENFILPFSHDEVVHGKRAMLDKMPGDAWQKFANLRALYGYMFSHPGKKLMFMGGEIGQWREWDHDGSVDWNLLEYPLHDGLRRLVRDLNTLYRAEPSLHEVDFEPAGFQWIDCNDSDASVVSLIRRARDPHDFTVTVLNLTPVVRHQYRVGVPEAGRYLEVLNTDAGTYGGSNVGNMGGVATEEVAAHGHDQSLSLELPPLACVIFKPER